MAATAPQEDRPGHVELLRLLAEGLSTDHILELVPRTTRSAIAAAAQAGLQAMLAIDDHGAAPRRPPRERKWTEQQLEVRREHPRNWEPWNEVEDAVLAESFAAGTSVEDLASDHGRTLGAVRRRLTKLGLIEESAASNDETPGNGASSNDDATDDAPTPTDEHGGEGTPSTPTAEEPEQRETSEVTRPAEKRAAEG